MKKALFFALCSGGLQLFAQNINTGLTACYPLNGNGNESINILTGTLNSVSAANDRSNTAGSAVAFSGSSASYISLPNDPLLKPANAISVSGWYKLDVTNVNMTLVFTKNVYSSYFTAYGIAAENTTNGYKFRACRQDGVGSDFAVSTTVPQANTWYHVVFCIDNTSMKLYVNGNLETTVTNNISSFNYDSTRDIILGGNNESNFNQPYSGSIDNVRIYSRVITPAEVDLLYKYDAPCVGNVPNSLFAIPSQVICPKQPVNFYDQSSNSPLTWSWQVGAGGSVSSATVANPVITFSTAGTYTVSLTTTNQYGTGNVKTMQVLVSTCTGLKADGSDLQGIHVFPNPGSGVFSVENETGAKSFIISNSLGQVMVSGELQQGKSSLDLSELAQGVYFIVTQGENGRSISRILKDQ
jgi:PKD repeat protein